MLKSGQLLAEARKRRSQAVNYLESNMTHLVRSTKRETSKQELIESLHSELREESKKRKHIETVPAVAMDSVRSRVEKAKERDRNAKKAKLDKEIRTKKATTVQAVKEAEEKSEMIAFKMLQKSERGQANKKPTTLKPAEYSDSDNELDDDGKGKNRL